MPIANAVREAQVKSSWIRKMFEEGAALKQQHGAGNVFDFSIGNPDVNPPQAFHDALVRLASDDAPGSHGYMPNTGFPDVRARLAERASEQQGVELEGKHVVMSVGAAGGLNVVLKAVLNPGDEVIVPRPFFVEYGAYISNHGGTMVLVDSADDFDLDIGAIAAAMNERTAAVIITSPHNPTGRVYSGERIAQLAEALRAHGQKCGRKAYLIADEPYREIVYSGVEVPPLLAAYQEAIVVTSYSKSLSLPGERIGYIAVNPAADDVDELLGALGWATRVLGYVNAPALMQRIVGEIVDARVDTDIYARRRDAFISVLDDAGIEYANPQGAFYLFCRVPSKSGAAAGDAGTADNAGTADDIADNAADDIAFVKALKEQLILSVPGTGFGAPGWFRLSYCVDESIIESSRSAFKKAVADWLK